MYKNEVTLTKDGLLRMRENYERLKARYKEVSRELRRSIQDGEANDPIVQIKGLEQEFLLGDIQKLEVLLLGAKLIRKVRHPKYARAGMRVQYKEDDKLFDVTLVDSIEADPHRGLISVESPIGRALLNHKVDDAVVALTPVGTKRLTITYIR